jgi:hypothetical protein
MAVCRQTSPDVCGRLADDVAADPYVRFHLRGQVETSGELYVPDGPGARDVIWFWRPPHGIEVWLEANTDDARSLLRCLPVDQNVNVSMGNPRALKMLQEEPVATITGLSLFSMTDRTRFRPAGIHPVGKLTVQDRAALERFPTSHNRDLFFRFFDEGKVGLYGCYEGNEIVGYAPLSDSAMVGLVEVRPEFQRQAYGRSLLRACMAELLESHEMVFFDACMDDLANVRLCLAVGFVPIGQMIYATGRLLPAPNRSSGI